MINRSLCILLLTLLSARSGFAAAASFEGLPSADQAQLAQRVHRIFAAKCVDCHGADLPHPKGKFGYVLDLKRVANNPDYVVRGHPEKSDLYDMVFDDDMPGKDASVEPLTDAEKATIKRWIKVGAPYILPVVSLGAVAQAEAKVSKSAAPPQRELPPWQRLIRWVGRFHPLSTHFPVALMYVALIAEALAWWTRRDSWLQTVRFLVFFGAGGSLVAAGLGWINAYFTSYVGASADILVWHRWLGTFTALWATACAVLSIRSECEEGSQERRRFRGALIIGAVLVGISGFLGSALIYGLDHYSWN
ncbi:MAG: DUF2231 domain-containing protein [Chthoniobacteraceae bacterium]